MELRARHHTEALRPRVRQPFVGLLELMCLITVEGTGTQSKEHWLGIWSTGLIIGGRKTNAATDRITRAHHNAVRTAVTPWTTTPVGHWKRPQRPGHQPCPDHYKESQRPVSLVPNREQCSSERGVTETKQRRSRSNVEFRCLLNADQRVQAMQYHKSQEQRACFSPKGHCYTWTKSSGSPFPKKMASAWAPRRANPQGAPDVS